MGIPKYRLVRYAEDNYESNQYQCLSCKGYCYRGNYCVDCGVKFEGQLECPNTEDMGRRYWGEPTYPAMLNRKGKHIEIPKPSEWATRERGLVYRLVTDRGWHDKPAIPKRAKTEYCSTHSREHGAMLCGDDCGMKMYRRIYDETPGPIGASILTWARKKIEDDIHYYLHGDEGYYRLEVARGWQQNYNDEPVRTSPWVTIIERHVPSTR